MKIAFDGREMIGNSGIATYSRELVRSLSSCYPSDLFNLYCEPSRETALINVFNKHKNVTIKPILYNQTGIKLIAQMKRELNKRKWKNISEENDVVHQTNQYSLIKNISNLVVTVHDLFPLTHDESLSKNKRNKYHSKINYISISAKQIIVPSEHVRSEMTKFYPNACDKIIVTYEAASDQFKIIENKQDTFALIDIKYSLNPNYKYFIFLGRLYKRKNVNRVLKAFDRLVSEYQNVGMILIINGNKNELMDFNENEIRMKYPDKIVIIDQLKQSELVEFYNKALGLVFPSLAEGFGLPVIEAMKCGCPVITSNTTSLPEVAGEAAIMVNPEDDSEIFSAMIQLLTNADLRKELIDKGLKHVMNFSWDKTANLTYFAYREVYNNK